MERKQEKTLIIAALAIFCIALITSAQPVQATTTYYLVFNLMSLGLAIGSWVTNIFQPPPAGVDADSHLSLFYHAKDNEFRSLTVAMDDLANSISNMGYYLGRKTEYAAMSYLNNTLYPTYPTMKILNASILPELSSAWKIYLAGYTSSIYDAVRYASASFTGPLNALDLKADTTSVKGMTNDFELVYGSVINYSGIITHNYNTTYLVSNTTIEVIVQSVFGYSSNGFKHWQTGAVITDVNNASNIFDLYGQTGSTDPPHAHYGNIYQEIPAGIYAVTLYLSDALPSNENTNITGMFDGSDQAAIGIWSDSLFIMSDTNFTGGSSTRIYSEDANALYTELNFIDSQSTTYTISVTNATQSNISNYASCLELGVNFANSLANTYWTALRNAGIYNISQIPANMVIPLPDFIFISNLDLLKLSEAEIMAMYLAYMNALRNFFNSTTYNNIVNFNTANVTYSNMAVIVDGTLYRNNTIITNGSLYLQIYADMGLVIGNNTLNSSGLVYNLNDTTCFTYAPNDILNITAIWIKNGTSGYVSVQNVIITAESIHAYLYTSYSGPPAVPAGSGTGAGSSGGGFLIIIAILVLLLIFSKGSGGGGSGSPVIIQNSKKQSTLGAMEHGPHR